MERLSSFRGDFLSSVYTRVLSGCPLLEGLSSFGVHVLYRRFHCTTFILHSHVASAVLLLQNMLVCHVVT